MSESQQKSQGVRFIEVDPEQSGQRIDNFLLAQLKGVPRSYVYRILRKGEVRVNKGRAKATYRLQVGDNIRIPPVRLPSQAEVTAPPRPVQEQIEHSVIYEDDRLLVLDKPSGLAVHGGSGLSFGVIEALRALRPNERHLELVHRLDRDTSGCLLISKRNSVLRTLHELIRENRVDKRYLALLAGSWRKGRQVVRMPLRKNTLQGGERVVRVDAEGKPAETRFVRLERFKRATLVEAELITGRTHQIRVHSAWLGSPVIGDVKYGDEEANRWSRSLGLRRLFLHAVSLKFKWPGEKQAMEIHTDLPPELEEFMQKLRQDNEI